MKTRLKFTLVTALVFILLSVFFLIPSFADDYVSVEFSFSNGGSINLDGDDLIDGFTSTGVTLDSVHTLYIQQSTGYYYNCSYNGTTLSRNPDNPTLIPFSNEIIITTGNTIRSDSSVNFYFIIESPLPTPVPTPTPPPPNLWDTIGDTTGGIFQVGTSILNGILANDIIAFFVIAIPIFGVLVAIVFGIVGIAKNRKKKKNQKR